MKSGVSTALFAWMAMALCAAPPDAKPAKTYTFPPVGKLPVHSGMPDPFVKPDGTRLTSKAEWPAQRDYLKAMMAYYQFGERPPLPKDFGLEKLESKSVFAGKAVQERYRVDLSGGEQGLRLARCQRQAGDFLARWRPRPEGRGLAGPFGFRRLDILPEGVETTFQHADVSQSEITR